MSSSPYGLQNPKFDTLESGFAYTRTSYTALTTSYGASGAWTCEAAASGGGETVILIDEVRIGVRAAQYKGAISGALSGAAVTSVVVGTAIPTGTPAVGVLYLRRTTGANTAISAIPYTSWAGSTFTIGSTDFSTGNVANGSVVTASADLIVTLKINAVEIPIHFPASAQESMTDTFVWKPKGNLVVTSTSLTDALNAKASLATSAWISMKLRHVRKAAALQMGLWSGGGIPLVAVSGATTAATAKQVIAPLAGHHVEILSLVYTGHSHVASAANDFRVGFWDGTAGSTFTNAQGGKMIHRFYAQGANSKYAPRTIINDTKGCIAGPVGYGVYVQATTHLAGSAPLSDCVILYRYIKGTDAQYRGTLNATLTGSVTAVVMAQAIPTNLPPVGTITIRLTNGTDLAVAYTSYTASTFTIASTAIEAAGGNAVTSTFSAIDVLRPAGQLGANTLGKKWWAFTESLTGFTGGATGQEVLQTYASSQPVGSMRVRGYSISYLGNGTEGASPAITFLGVGTDVFNPITEVHSFNNNSNLGASEAVSQTITCDDMIRPVMTSQGLAINGADVTSTVTGRSVLVWGTMSGKVDNGVENVRSHI